MGKHTTAFDAATGRVIWQLRNELYAHNSLVLHKGIVYTPRTFITWQTPEEGEALWVRQHRDRASILEVQCSS